ncbi:MOS1T transposase, partial [Pseudoatta argentina]
MESVGLAPRLRHARINSIENLDVYSTSFLSNFQDSQEGEANSDNALSDTTCRDWFRRFKNNDFELEDKERSGAPAMHPEKRPLYAQRHDKVILLHDNARPHVAKPVKTYLETLKWEVLPHPPYSPDIAPSDFHLFRSMAHGLADRRIHSYEEAQKWIDSWIASKDMSFFRRGIHVLPERWEKVVSSNGQYFK